MAFQYILKWYSLMLPLQSKRSNFIFEIESLCILKFNSYLFLFLFLDANAVKN